ncbi:alpha/beta hydrolase family protein [Phenylobacterium sp.]|uniref:alpha/beta hydrolase family protein n=1 Tax=Phenylobacterium sp. TaxID=1871053 RepID=UPI0039834616
MALLGFLSAASVASAEPAPLSAYMDQPRQAPDAVIAYGEAPSQVVELFLPKGRGTHPVVVLLHGGCYRQQLQGLPQTGGIARDLARRGFAVWNVEYRRLGEPGAGYPGTFHDVATAVDRIRQEAPRYRLDAARVIGLGHSAGGHLALWAAARHRLPVSSPLHVPDPLPIRAVVSLGGIGDIEAHGNTIAGACGADTYPRMLGTEARKEPYADTSPARLLPSGARVVMIHGAYDHVMPPFTALAYVTTVRKAGDRADVIAIPDAGHFDVVIPTTAAWKIVAATVAREVKALGRRGR